MYHAYLTHTLNRHSLKFTNWTKLEKTIEQKNNVLLSLFSILAMATAGIQIIIDLSHQNYIAVGMDISIVISMIIVYVINEKRKHLTAKLLFIGLLNILLFIYASIIPKDTGVYLFFFPVIGITALIFDRKSSSLIRNVVISIPILFVGLLEISYYQFFGKINIQEGIEDPYSFPINLLISLLVTAFSIYQMMTINREIDKKRLAIANELKNKNEDLKKSNTELDHFVYSTSHDLKAPLSSISGLINIARHEIKEKTALEYFDLIDNRVDKLNSFIKDIIDLSRNSRLDLILEKVDVAELINNAIENNRYMENASSIAFETNILTQSIVKIDRARLEVVLNNLISNAIKYHKTEGDRFINISILRGRSNLKITLKDNGIGIGKEHLTKVFDMFYRGHEESEGSGLGLYIVNDVIGKMNGEITLDSKENVGTEIMITLPIN